MLSWFEGNESFFWWWIAAAFALSVVGAIVLPILISRLPVDYFVGERRRPLESLRARHPLLRIALIVLKNLAGVGFVALGVLMLIGPGPGILSFLVAISLLDFPGKHRFEQRLARNRVIHRILDSIRIRFHRPVFQLPGRAKEYQPRPDPPNV